MKAQLYAGRESTETARESSWQKHIKELAWFRFQQTLPDTSISYAPEEEIGFLAVQSPTIASFCSEDNDSALGKRFMQRIFRKIGNSTRSELHSSSSLHTLIVSLELSLESTFRIRHQTHLSLHSEYSQNPASHILQGEIVPQ